MNVTQTPPTPADAQQKSQFLSWPRPNDEWERGLRALMPYAEELWSRVLMAEGRGARGHARTYTVAGLVEGDGASTTATALAHYLANGLEQRVLMVEADLRTPSLRRMGLVPRGPGLAGVLQRQVRLKYVVFDLPRVGFHVLPAGATLPSPSAHLNPTKLGRLLRAVEPHFDVILFDAPPLTVAPEARHLIGVADATIPVLRSGKTLPEQAAYWLAKIPEYGGKIGAICLNGVESTLPTKLRGWF